MSPLKDELSYEAELLGTTLGTPPHERMVRKLQVQKCQELNNVSFCSSCSNYYDCTLVKQHLRDRTEFKDGT